MPVITHRIRGIKKDIEDDYLRKFDFRMGEAKGCIIHLIADEDVELEAGEIRPIKIQPVKVWANTVLSACPYARHGVGHVISVGQERPGLIEEDRVVDTALFIAGVKGEVSEGELIGVIKTFPIKLIEE